MKQLKNYELKAGDAIFTYRNNWLSRRIFWFSKWRVPKNRQEKISHVALYLGEVKGIPMLAEADWRIVIKPISIYDHKKYTIHVARPKNIIFEQKDINKLRRFALNKQGERYAYRQILGHFIKKIFGLNKVGDWDKDSMICSEFYLEALARIGFFIGGKDPADYNPLEIYASDKMDRVKEKD